MYSVHMLYLFLNHNIMVLFVRSRASDDCAPPVPCSVAPAYIIIMCMFAQEPLAAHAFRAVWYLVVSQSPVR